MIKAFRHIPVMKAAFFSSCFFVLGCENDFNEVRDLGKKKNAQEEANNIESYISENAIVKAKLISPYMLRTEGDTNLVEFPRTLHVDFYNDSAKVESKLFARYGRYYENKGKVLLRDSVIVFNIQGDTLKCDELWWDQNKQIFYTDKQVHIRKPDEKIDGTGLVADQNFKSWTITNAKGPINVPDSTLPAN